VHCAYDIRNRNEQIAQSLWYTESALIAEGSFTKAFSHLQQTHVAGKGGSPPTPGGRAMRRSRA
jgi:hypothetical protein